MYCVYSRRASFEEKLLTDPHLRKRLGWNKRILAFDIKIVRSELRENIKYIAQLIFHQIIPIYINIYQVKINAFSNSFWVNKNLFIAHLPNFQLTIIFFSSSISLLPYCFIVYRFKKQFCENMSISCKFQLK